MNALPVTLHDGVRVSTFRGTVRITDPATGIDEHITTATQNPPDLEALVSAFLLINGLARANRETRLRVMEVANVRDASTRRQIHRWGNLRRTLAPSRSGWVLMNTLRGVSQKWGAVVVVISIAAALTLISLGVDLPTALEFSAAPSLLLVVIAAHESGHWLAVRRLVGTNSGALLVGWSICAVAYPVREDSHQRRVAFAGPLAGAGTAGLATTIFFSSPSLAAVGGLLLAVNLLGFTPLTQDGRDGFTSRTNRPTSTP